MEISIIVFLSKQLLYFCNSYFIYFIDIFLLFVYLNFLNLQLFASNKIILFEY